MMERLERKKRFIRLLAEFLAGDESSRDGYQTRSEG